MAARRSSLAEAIAFVEGRPAAVDAIDREEYDGLTYAAIEEARQWFGRATREIGSSRAGNLEHDCRLLLEQLRCEGRRRF